MADETPTTPPPPPAFRTIRQSTVETYARTSARLAPMFDSRGHIWSAFRLPGGAIAFAERDALEDPSLSELLPLAEVVREFGPLGTHDAAGWTFVCLEDGTPDLRVLRSLDEGARP